MRGIVISVALGAVSAPVMAEPIVLESYGGPRPAGADKLLAPVISELGQSGFPARSEIARRIEERLSRSLAPLDEAGAAVAVRSIEAGYKRFVAGDFDGAVGDLEKGVAALAAAPGAVAGKADRREALMRGLLGLALSQRRLGRQTEATAAMAELIRSFPDREISYKEYGPEPRDFFQKVERDLGREGRGALTVDVDDDKAVVFINERYAGVGDVSVVDLLPGRYRIFLQQGDQPGRIHEVEVEPGRTAALTVSWQLDAVLRPGAALVFPDEEARGQWEARHAVRIARALGAPSVVVLGIRDNRGRRSVVGAVYSTESTRPLRSGAVAIEPVVPASERLEALARLLAGDEAAADLVAPLGEPGPGGDGGAIDGGGGSRPVRVWKWVALGGGLAAIAGGVTLIAIHQGPVDGERVIERNSRGPGIIAASAGAALTGLGVLLFFKDSRDRRRERSAAIVPLDGGAALVLGGSF